MNCPRISLNLYSNGDVKAVQMLGKSLDYEISL